MGKSDTYFRVDYFNKVDIKVQLDNFENGKKVKFQRLKRFWKNIATCLIRKNYKPGFIERVNGRPKAEIAKLYKAFATRH